MTATASSPNHRAPDCLRCNDSLAGTWRPWERRWQCYQCGHFMSEKTAALHRLGPFAPSCTSEPPHAEIPGFMRIGPTTYKRISEPPRIPAQWANRAQYEPIPWRLLAFIGVALLLAVVC